MESLALLVAIIVTMVVLAGPIALMVSHMGFKVIGALLGIMAILIGGFWVCVAPFPTSLLGGISLICGAKALNKI